MTRSRGELLALVAALRVEIDFLDAKRLRAQLHRDKAMRELRELGVSARDIGKAAGISHPRVLAICRDIPL